MKILILATLLATVPQDFSRCIQVLTGAATIEELDETEVEHFQQLAEHPLNLNSATRSRLLSSGMMSVYQVASLMDFRSRTGDILSLEELSLVDGFSHEFVRSLAPFITLSPSSSPFSRRSDKLSNTLQTRVSARMDEDGGATLSYALKECLSIGQSAELYWSTRTTYSIRTPGIGTVSAAYYGRHHLGKLVLGHFNARFGQGLTMWSGFSMSGAGSVTSLCKNPSGIGATSSFSPSLCGVASDWNFGRWTISAACSFPFLPIVNVAGTFRNLNCSLTVTDRTVSSDWRLGTGDLCFYGELAWDGAAAGLAGLRWVPSYGQSLALSLRYYSPKFRGDNAGALRSSTKVRDESGVSAAYSSKVLNVTMDACMHPEKKTSQLKGSVKLAPEYEIRNFIIKPSVMVNLRLRPQETSRWRNSVRSEIDASLGPFNAHARLEFLKCRDLSWLTYSELGYNTSVSAVIRWTLFKVDNWDDRIYAYEHDVPGTFNTPAYYGRGWGLSVYAGWKINVRHSLYLRASTLQYRWMAQDKPSRSEIRLQYRLSL